MEAAKDSGARSVFVHLKVAFMTNWGDRVVIYGEGALLGNWSAPRGYSLSCHHVGSELIWETIISVNAAADMVYRYAIVGEDNRVVKEDTETRRISFPVNLHDGAVVKVYDMWQDASDPSYVLSRSAFDVIFGRNRGGKEGGAATVAEPAPLLAAEPDQVIVRFRIWDWEPADHESVAVVGSVAELGDGDVEGGALMTRQGDGPVWEAEVSLPRAVFPVEYSYVRVGGLGGPLREPCEPRVAAIVCPGDPLDEPASLVVRHDGYYPAEQHWRGAGVAVPVFALRSVRSVGVGDFRDVRALVDVCERMGLHMVQLLPVNDTSVYRMWWDSYPYSTLSVFALHPLYLVPEELMDPLPDDIQGAVDATRRRLEALPEVDYTAVMDFKLDIARRCFELCGAATLASAEFEEWYAGAKEWLRPYAAFCFLRDVMDTSEHWRWGAASAQPAQMVERICDPSGPYYSQIALQYYLQWHLHRQLLATSRYAASQRVALKGDLPIGVDKRSVDTWMHPHLFRMDKSTGAPPDVFDPNGQNWGFPTYNWEAMAEDDYAWWRRRLANMAQYFHAYRIDHVLGFFRIWEIPADCTSGILGHFRPSHPLWRHELEARGIWDFDRLCEPYVTTKMLESRFGDTAYEVIGRYFREGFAPRLVFREPYSSESAIASISTRTGSPEWLVEETAAVRKGLMALRQNVVLLRDPDDKDKYYPRFGLRETQSFADLNPWWQEQLADLHDDYFYRRQDELWRSRALQTLPVLMGATSMMVCGEDLGMIPACVHPVMQELGIVGLRIQRMSGSMGQEFGDPASYPYMAVASPSCHDTTNIRAWYEEDAARSERFYYEALNGRGAAPPTATPEVVQLTVQQHMESPAMLAIFTLQDLLALKQCYAERPAAEETINDPTNPKHYWRYRMHVSLDTLLQDEELLRTVRALTEMSGRNRHTCAAKVHDEVIGACPTQS